MSYREENGQVVLTMKAEDYEMILMALGAFTAMRMNTTTQAISTPASGDSASLRSSRVAARCRLGLGGTSVEESVL